MRAITVTLLLACSFTLLAQSPADVGIVMEVSGDWFLKSDAKAKLSKGRALPAGDFVSSSSNVGKIVVQIYNKTAPDPYNAPTGFPLPPTLDNYPSNTERFWRIFQRLFGGRPDDYSITISQINVEPVVVATDLDPRQTDYQTIFSADGKVAFYTLNQVKPSDSYTFFNAAIYGEKPKGNFIWDEKAYVRPQGRGGSHQVSNYYPALREQLRSMNPPKVSLKEAVLEGRDGWVDLGPLLGSEALGGYALAFRWIAGRGPASTHYHPDVLFSWPAPTHRSPFEAHVPDFKPPKYEVNLGPGVYRVTLYSLSLNQPQGSDAWILVEPPAAFEKAKLDFDGAVGRTQSWPPQVEKSVSRSFLRVYLQYLLEPNTN